MEKGLRRRSWGEGAEEKELGRRGGRAANGAVEGGWEQGCGRRLWKEAGNRAEEGGCGRRLWKEAVEGGCGRRLAHLRDTHRMGRDLELLLLHSELRGLLVARLRRRARRLELLAEGASRRLESLELGTHRRELTEAHEQRVAAARA